MATFSRAFETAVVDATLGGQADNVSSTGAVSATVDISAHYGAHVQIHATTTAPTDNMTIDVETSAEGTVWDLTPLLSFALLNTSPNAVSFVVKDVRLFRVRCTAIAGGDTFTVNMRSARYDTVSV